MYVYKVMVGVELMNELLRKSGGGGTASLRRDIETFWRIVHKHLFFFKRYWITEIKPGIPGKLKPPPGHPPLKILPPPR